MVDNSPLPPLGQVPDTMLACTLRSERLGEPVVAFQTEEVRVPEPAGDEVLIAVMAAGVNYNNVWAARGVPIDVIAARRKRGSSYSFHIGGSDAAGIVWAIGRDVERISVGQEVVVHPGHWDTNDPSLNSGADPMLLPSGGIWGYDTSFGAFAEFCIAQSHQVLPKPAHLSWEQAAAPNLVGTTAYRMLHGWPGHEVMPGDVVLVWGGAGGVGGQALQLAREAEARPLAVVSSEEKGRYCKSLGAEGWIDRTEFNHWGEPPHWSDSEGQRAWIKVARTFGERIWDILGERKNPRLVIEHPGEDTIPTSIFCCDTGGMVVVCAGTTGYSAVVDLRYHWTRQKRLQGSHGSNDQQACAYNELLSSGRINPCLGDVRAFDEIGQAHQDMLEGHLAMGNTVVRVRTA